jgi:hypothetical protein
MTFMKKRMIQFKKLGFGIMFAMIGCIGIPNAEAQYGNDAWTERFIRQHREFTEHLLEGQRLAKACDQAGKGSHACKQYDEYKARDAKRRQALEQYTGTRKGYNAAGQISNSVNKSQQRLEYSKSASQYRQNADYWKQEYNRAVRAGDRSAAEYAQRLYHYNEQKAQEYKQ